MKTIFKYQVDRIGAFIAPAPATVLSAAEQSGHLFVWVLVDTDRLPMQIRITVKGTGKGLTGNEGGFINTVHTNNGDVWHVFAEGE